MNEVEIDLSEIYYLRPITPSCEALKTLATIYEELEEALDKLLAMVSIYADLEYGVHAKNVDVDDDLLITAAKIVNYYSDDVTVDELIAMSDELSTIDVDKVEKALEFLKNAVKTTIIFINGYEVCYAFTTHEIIK